MKKERFVNELILIKHLPAFPHFPEDCISKEDREKHLDKIIDTTEEYLILEKAEEIKKNKE